MRKLLLVGVVGVVVLSIARATLGEPFQGLSTSAALFYRVAYGAWGALIFLSLQRSDKIAS